MKKHTILTAFVAAFSLLALGCSCCCANDNAVCDKKNCKDAQCPPNAVQKAVTPDGEVIYVVAVWNANCESMPPGKGCKTAQCWQTSDGKTLCVKPLKKCTNASENGQKFQTANGTAMTTETDNNKVINNDAALTSRNKRAVIAYRDVVAHLNVLGIYYLNTLSNLHVFTHTLKFA